MVENRTVQGSVIPNRILKRGRRNPSRFVRIVSIRSIPGIIIALTAVRTSVGLPPTCPLSIFPSPVISLRASGTSCSIDPPAFSRGFSAYAWSSYLPRSCCLDCSFDCGTSFVKESNEGWGEFHLLTLFAIRCRKDSLTPTLSQRARVSKILSRRVYPPLALKANPTRFPRHPLKMALTFSCAGPNIHH